MILYQVLQCRILKTAAGAVAVARHNLRQNGSPGDYVDPENTKYNTYHGVTSYERFSEYYNAVLEQTKLKRKPQKNASRVVEFVVSTSHEYCSDWENNSASKEKLDYYFAAAEKFITERYGHVIISSAVHYDETTPHLHLLCIPLYRNPRTQAVSFSSSHFIGGIKDLRQLHTDFYEQVGKQVGLTRGMEGARTKHQDLKQYKKWEQEQEQKNHLARQQFELSEKDSKLSAREREIAGQNAAVDSRERLVEERELHVQGKEQAYKSYEKKAFCSQHSPKWICLSR